MLLSPLDAMFLRMESRRAPLHIGALMTFTLPDDADAGFTRTLHAEFSTLSFLPSPFDCRIAGGLLSAVVPRWERVRPDPEYHVRLSALPAPGTDRDLGTLVARLHSNPLDLSRPPWEAHIIEGLSGGRFAFYFKAHHCAVDGMAAMRNITRWLTTDPARRGGPGSIANKPQPTASGAARLRALSQSAAEGALGTGELAGRLLSMARGANSSVRAAMSTPRTPFNARITQQRRLAAQVLELPRLKAVARATGTTVNDVTLAVCGGAVRRYLLERDALPERSVMASVPVGLERTDETLNAASGFVCPLATEEADPLERLRTINAATTRGKQELLAMSSDAQQQYTLLGLLPLAVGQRTGTLARVPPLFNFTVSNVVLSKEPLYLDGARLELCVPMSFLCDGYGLNVTLVGYADNVTLGFVGCRDTIPHLQHLAVYAGVALAELETLTS